MSRRSLGVERSMLLALLLAITPFVGCSGDDGAAGAPGASTGTLQGTVTNGANSGAAVANATITTDPAVGVTITTDASGAYTANLPVGNYKLTVDATGFNAVEQNVSVLAAFTQTFDFEMTPTSNVSLSISGVPSGAAPGATFPLTVDVTPLDGSTVTGYAWTQTNSAQATIDDADQQTATITLGDEAEYKRALLEYLKHPAGEAVEGRFAPRFEVMSIDPVAHEHGAIVKFQCVVTTTSGSYTVEVPVEAEVPFATVAPGLRNVPVGAPVMMNGKDQATYDWALSVPSGSATTLMDADQQHPWFVPDINGLYTLTVTDSSVTADGGLTIDVFAGEWWGGIEGQDANGRPQTLCATACHATIHNDKFVDWSNTGHAEIFTNNINTGGHYGPDCFACHTVGYGKGGFDSTDDYAAFLDTMFPGGQSHPDPDNWSTVLSDWPNQAAMANVQCDNCHGPSNSPAHLDPDNARVNVSAGVCGTCHGEPPRHARFQQWQDSAHGNFETALAEGTNGSCSKCHSAQGFLEWLRVGNLSATFSGTAVPASEVQPITCVVCHDPHNVGTRSGDENNVPLRLEGDTPPLLGGFTATGVGKGAMCIICHNSRRGDFEEVINTTPDRAPHGGTQSDVMMGENAFLVPRFRGPHSFIADTCASCHLERTPPPNDLSYNLSGTNHTFGADISICADCHGNFDAESLMSNTESALVALSHAIEDALGKEIAFHTANGRQIRITGRVNGVSTTITFGAAAVVGTITLTEGSGRSTMSIVVDGTQYDSVQLHGQAKVVDGGSVTGSLLDNTYSQAGMDKILAKVIWNYHLVGNDGSRSVHNPGWVTQIIAAGNQALEANWP